MIDVMFNVSVPELVSFKLFVVLIVPTDRLPNARLVVFSVAFGAVPVPDRLAVCGLPDALSATDTFALLGPVEVGVN